MTGQSITARDFLAGWLPGGREVPHQRLERLLACAVSKEDLAADSLGMRNRRLLRINRLLSGRPLEGRLDCAACGAEIEFSLPEDAILAASTPSSDATVEVVDGTRTRRFRLPQMRDLALADTPDALAAACCLDADEPSLSAEVMRSLSSAFEAADPAGDIRVDAACPACGTVAAASIDVALFVAAELDRTYTALLREIDCLARAYGWSEAAIVALPAGRRRAYLAMILDRDNRVRPRVARQTA